MTAPRQLADACPHCHPGDYPATEPRAVITDVNGSLCAEYTHTATGGVVHTWATWWNPDSLDFPLHRTASGAESVSGPFREAKLRAKARMQVVESRALRAAGQRRAS